MANKIISESIDSVKRALLHQNRPLTTEVVEMSDRMLSSRKEVTRNHKDQVILRADSQHRRDRCLQLFP